MAQAPGSVIGEEITIDNKSYVWDGVKWVLQGGYGGSGGGGTGGSVTTLDVKLMNALPDGAAGDTQAAANQFLYDKTEANKVLLNPDASIVVVQDATPDINNYKQGDIWVNETTTDLHVKDSVNWLPVAGSKVAIGPTEPTKSNRYEGALWVNSVSNELSVLMFNNWTLIAGGSGGGGGTSKKEVYFSNVPPNTTGLDEGTLWINSLVYNLYVLDNGTWEAVMMDTTSISLANPTRSALQAIAPGPDGYPLPDGAVTQSNANDYLVQATDWLRLHKSEVIIQSGVPDVTLYNDGALWVDVDTYDMFVLSGGQWIDLTALPDMSDYVKDNDLQFILQEYLRKRDAIDQYYPVDRMVHVIEPNGSFKLHLADGQELDNYVKRIIDLERGMIHVQDQIDNLGGTGEVPPDASHPDGQYIFIGAGSANPGDGNWSSSYLINSWDQLSTLYISETDLDGQIFNWANYSGEFVQAYRYIGNPHVGADYSCSCVFRVNSVNDRGDFCTVSLSVQPGTERGILGIGEYFTFEIVDEGTN